MTNQQATNNDATTALKRKFDVTKDPSIPVLTSNLKSSVTMSQNVNTRPQHHSAPTLSIESKGRLENSTVKPAIASENPVVFLRAYFAEVAQRSQERPSCHSNYFTRPSEEEMAAYDAETVNSIRARDIERLRALQKQGRSLNACNRFGESLLHMACRRGNADVVAFLVNEGKVKINTRDDYGRTPFHDACWTSSPNLDVMDVLLSVADPHMLLAEDVRGHTPFDYARKEHWGTWTPYLRQRCEKMSKRKST